MMVACHVGEDQVMEEDQFWPYIKEYMSGSISDERRRELMKWAESSSTNQEAFRHYCRIWLASSVEEPSGFDVDEGWKAFAQMAGIPRRRSVSPAVIRIAAAVLLLVSIGYLFFISTSSPSYTTVSSVDEVQMIMLPDSSQVWLNRESTISYSESFGSGDRDIELTGEAFFDVRKNTTLPFIVRTSKARIRVTGTSFSVNAFPEAPTEELTVVTGRVIMSENETGTEEVAMPGNKVTLLKSRNELQKELNTDLNFLSWKTHELIFDKTPLDEVVHALVEYYNIKMKIEPDHLRCRFTGHFKNASLEEVTNILALTLNVRFVQHNDVYVISGEGCAP
jgi:ferric-dicitrate binding protein FerR (iron transport regulator)